MADGYLLENAVDKYLLQDGTGVYLLEGVLPPLVVTPFPASSAAIKVDPVIVLGSIAIAPPPSLSVAVTLLGATVLGSITIMPGIASARSEQVDPAVLILGALVYIGMAYIPMLDTRMTKMRGFK